MWLCIGVTLLVTPPVLAVLSGLYIRYVVPYEHHTGFLDSDRHPILTLNGLLHNAAFMLSHLTNQGKFQFSFLNYSIGKM